MKTSSSKCCRRPKKPIHVIDREINIRFCIQLCAKVQNSCDTLTAMHFSIFALGGGFLSQMTSFGQICFVVNFRSATHISNDNHSRMVLAMPRKNSRNKTLYNSHFSTIDPFRWSFHDTARFTFHFSDNEPKMRHAAFVINLFHRIYWQIVISIYISLNRNIIILSLFCRPLVKKKL